jgi:hypothetical protein
MPSFNARKVKQTLKKHDKRFEFFTGGKHQCIIYHPDINGHKASCPLPEHPGDVSKYVLQSIVRRFNLPLDFFK